MAAEVYEDSLELIVPILEAVLPDSEQYLSTAYPYPSLRITGRQEKRRFRTIVLENPYLRATIVPDLGGRILCILDKRTNIEIFPDEPLTAIEGGLRGVEIPQGIQIRYATQDRHNSLGTVNYQLVHADEEEDEAGVWIGEISGSLSFNALISVPPDRTEIRIEMRMFNRMMEDAPYNGGLTVRLSNSEIHFTKNPHKYTSQGYLMHSPDAAISIWTGSYWHPGAVQDEGRLSLHRFGKETKFSLGARHLDTWKFTICPHTGVSWPMIACKDAAISFVDEGICIQSSHPLSSHRLRLIDASQQSFEAPINAIPEKRLDLPYENSRSLSQLLFFSDAGKMLLQQGGGVITKDGIEDEFAASRDAIAEQDTRARREIRSSSQVDLFKLLPAFRYEGHLRRAQNSTITKTRLAKIDEDLEQALLYNGEDHLAWWMKAHFKRVAEGGQVESQELLNAHYLAPLEPCLRAEGFLSQPMAQGREPNPVLRPLDESPDQFVEVACQLMQWWQVAEASRFLDEALRHIDLPMLRYLQAFALGETRMEVEAASHMKAAAAKPFAPPFPWRLWERHVLHTLHKRFPHDEYLKQYLRLAEKQTSAQDA